MAGLMFLVHPIGVRIPVPEKNNHPRDGCFCYHHIDTTKQNIYTSIVRNGWLTLTEADKDAL